MGNFYTNFTLRGPTQEEVARSLKGYKAIVTPASNGCLVVYEETADSQNSWAIAELAAKLSLEHRCPVLAVLNHDDDILCFELYSSGTQIDKYNSCPEYFGESEDEGPTGGDAKKLCKAFGSPHTDEVEDALRSADYAFAYERHLALADALGIPLYAVGSGYRYVSGGELPEGLSEDDLVHTS